MNSNIPLRVENVSLEVWARILKAVSKKYDCSLNIDFSQGNMEVEFVGDDASKKHITQEVRDMFRNGFKANSELLEPSEADCKRLQNIHPPPTDC